MKWQKVKLGEVCQIISGSTPRTGVEDLWDGEIAWATPRDLSKLDSVYIEKTAQRITEKGFKSCSTQMLPVGSVLLSSRAPIGHVAINTIPICTNQGFKNLIPNEKLHNKFLYYWLRANREFLDSLGNGATFKEVSKAIVERVEIPLPPLDEQKRIASILDAADALRRVRRQSLARLDELAQSLFLELFGDPATNPKGWEMRKLGEIGELDRGQSKHRPRDAPELFGGDYPFIQTGDVARSGGYIRKFSQTYSEVGLKQSKLWPTGTLCITIAANIAKTAMLTFDACFPDSVVGFKTTQCEVEYVRHWFGFMQSHMEAMAPESAQKNINLKILREFPIPLPPLSLQQTFAGQIEELERIKARGRAQLAELDALFASLQERAFDGRL